MNLSHGPKFLNDERDSKCVVITTFGKWETEGYMEILYMPEMKMVMTVEPGEVVVLSTMAAVGVRPLGRGLWWRFFLLERLEREKLEEGVEKLLWSKIGVLALLSVLGFMVFQGEGHSGVLGSLSDGQTRQGEN